MMRDCRQFYIDGAWIEAEGRPVIDVINPATEGVAGVVAIGTVQDVDRAVAAARTAFPSWSQTSVEERLAVLDRVIEAYQARYADLAAAVTEEMGAPAWLAEQAQAVMGLAHFQKAREILASYEFNEFMGTTSVLREPVGVCAFITPWNWPLNQIACKVAPALAVGCTMVLKPSEVAPFSASIFAQVMHDAGVPAGVFNLVHGDGPGVGTALAEHPDVDMISFTGSTQAGIAVARNAAPTVKRVHQELGGKSPHVILTSADLAAAGRSGGTPLMVNSG